jgi:putative protein kinase ArgK-like GTPase of G3E family
MPSAAEQGTVGTSKAEFSHTPLCITFALDVLLVEVVGGTVQVHVQVVLVIILATVACSSIQSRKKSKIDFIACQDVRDSTL